MGQKIPTMEFLGEDDPERLKKCRLMAAEASSLATAATNPEVRASRFEKAVGSARGRDGARGGDAYAKTERWRGDELSCLVSSGSRFYGGRFAVVRTKS